MIIIILLYFKTFFILTKNFYVDYEFKYIKKYIFKIFRVFLRYYLFNYILNLFTLFYDKMVLTQS